ncbi:MAG: MBL fold metallo-hydrolase [Treponema sp.]|jgi:phosphoribosyl 1,2-cyclic phosphate phosphodiesterase|nr:MBL fold metallo-hydrolase [Treponema sp.]
MKLIVLGSGTSHGIPVIGCDCPVCHSRAPRDKRTRASLFIAGDEGEAAVIDTGPEFRLQAIRTGIHKLDAVFLTHAHADHLHGLDDVRSLTREKPLPVYGNRATLREVEERFSYAFRQTQRGGGKPRLVLVEAEGPVSLGSLRFTPVPVKHGRLDILGWRIDGGTPAPAVYLTDISEISPAARKTIGRPEVLIIDGLRARPHETHFTFEQALVCAVEMDARRVFLTHICHDCTHREINKYCRTFIKTRGLSGISMEAAWDGLTIVL